MAVPRRARRISRRIALVVGMLAALWTSPVQAAEVGTVPDLTWGVTRSEVDRTVGLLRENGVRWVRMNASWAAVEPNYKGSLDAGALASLDYAVDAVHAAGIRVVMPIADGVPYWASADPGKRNDGGTRTWNRYWRPERSSDYADVVGAIVRRYSARGVHHYEIWNEPNHPRFWPSGASDPAEYADLLRAGSAAVRAADPAATVLLGGLAGNDYLWLDRLYATGVRGAFDAVAVHPYTGSVDPTWCWNQAGTARKAKDAFCGLEEVRASMVAAGDGAKEIWATEFGWSTNTTAYGVSEAVQADYLRKAFERLEDYPYVKAAFWYSFRNVPWLRDDPASWEASTGLLRTDFTAKPALAALRDYTRGGGAAGVPPPGASPAAAPQSAPSGGGSPSTRPRRKTFVARVRRGSRVVRLRGRLAGVTAGTVAVRVSRRPLTARRSWRRVATRKVPLSRRGRWAVRLRLEARARYRVEAVYRKRRLAVTAQRRSTPVPHSTAR
jgi:polysaccharide biosynthesis protein PslG